MMQYIFMLLIAFSSCIETMELQKLEKSMRDGKGYTIEDMCTYILAKSNIGHDDTIPSTSETFNLLDQFFAHNNIKDYADAAKIGHDSVLFDDPHEFNRTMSSFFKLNTDDICPNNPKNYQAIIFNTSGVDVFMERLAFLSRLVKTKNFKVDEILALVGSHAHRKDLMNLDYLTKLPFLFNKDFDLATYNKTHVINNIETYMNQNTWTHIDGMEIAWHLIGCDSIMNELGKKFCYFFGNVENDTLRTEELIQILSKLGFKKKISKENPIAFICNAQGAAKTSEMVKKYFSHNSDCVDILIAKPVPDEIEGVLFNDTPQQRAMTKLFHFYRILETMVKK